MNVLLMALAGGCLYKWRGHASKFKKLLPRPFNQIAFALPYAAACATISWWAAGVVLIATTLAVLSGHGGFMDLGTWTRPRDDERLEFIIKPLRTKMSDYWYDALGLAITGLAVTIPAGIVLSNPFLALSGALKALAYMIGWKYFDASVATARGEFICGFFLWGALALTI